MFQRKIYLDSDSYIEVSTRVYDGKEQVMVTISGKKSDKERTMSSAIMSDAHAALFSQCLQDALAREPSWPLKEGESEEETDGL
jgi:hypothetical protein